MLDKIVLLLKDNIVIPKNLLLSYKDLKLTELELIIVIYLINSSVFDPKTISEQLKLKYKDVLDAIDDMINKGLIELKSNDKEEFIDLDGIYKKIAFNVINAKEDKNNTNIFDTFEKEFGRTLSPMEFEMINAWIDSGNSEELVILALKEAVYNGVTNLRYIDKIIHEWQKKGIKTKEDISKDRRNYKKNQVQIEDYDWLNNG